MNAELNLIILSCQKGDRKAQEKLYKMYFKYLISISLRYTNNKETAFELMNEAFLKVMLNLDKFNNDMPFEAWIRRIQINTCIDQFRKVNTKNKVELNSLNSNIDYENIDAGINYNEAENELEAEDLLHYLNTLHLNQKQVFNLYVFDGYNHKEIGVILNIPEGTSKWLLSEAKSNLRKLVSKKVMEIVKI